MRRFLIVVFWVGIGFALGWGYREIRAEVGVRRHAPRQKTAYATQPVMQDKPFVVITYVSDHPDWAQESLLSTFNQDYSNFRLIVIDDGIGVKPMESDKVLYIRSEKPKGSVEGLYRAFQGCRSEEIAIVLRNEERLAHHQVLKQLNRYFADPDVWMASGEEVRMDGFEKVAAGGCFHAFYAGLFQRLKLEDFVENGAFIKGDYEDVVTSSMLDLSIEHAYLIPELLVISPFEKKWSVRGGRYPRLADHPWHDCALDQEWVDCVVFSCNRPLQLYAFLESSEKHLENMHRQFVIYRAGNEHYEKGYQQVKKRFPRVQFLRQSIESPSGGFASLVHKVVFDRDVSPAHYVVFAVDDSLIKDRVDLQAAAVAMKETGAYGFYFGLGENLTSHNVEARIPIREGLNAWQYLQGEKEWAMPNSVDMALYRKEDIYPSFQCMTFHDPNILVSMWNEHADLSRIGLYYARSKVVDLPLNIVIANEEGGQVSTKELLTTFEQGLKMDITAVERLENDSIAIEIRPKFLER